PWFEAAGSFSAVFGLTWRIVFASLTAYLISSLLDVELFARLRARLNPGMRVVASNALSTLADSVVFIAIAFAGVFPPAQIGMLILGQYVVKLAVTGASVPLIYLVRATVEVGKSETA
ncbi:MAG: queuosine precursor transporter, partial [bacterium]